MILPCSGILVQGNGVRVNEADSYEQADFRNIDKKIISRCKQSEFNDESEDFFTPLLLYGSRVISGEGAFIVIAVRGSER